MELNPNHKVTQQARDQWHKVAALIMISMGKTEVDITMDHVDKVLQGGVNIVLDASHEALTGKLRVRLVDDRTANELARREGGRAIDS